MMRKRANDYVKSAVKLGHSQAGARDEGDSRLSGQRLRGGGRTWRREKRVSQGTQHTNLPHRAQRNVQEQRR